jgi:Ser/Thr protein kinase RdoA (MazF antagonist)
MIVPPDPRATGTDIMVDEQHLLTVLERYGLNQAGCHPIYIGNINRSFLITTADLRRFVLQRVNPMFPPSIHEDIEAVTRHLESKGLRTPHLQPTSGGDLYVVENGACWRLFSHIPGSTHDTVADEAAAFEAGGLLARFHKALLDLDYEFSNLRPPVHDTARHMEILRATLAGHRNHPRRAGVLPLAGEILELSEGLPSLPTVAQRKVHGDPKINNVIFEEATGRALCLVDFDTLGNMALYLELGDAFRSWCNPLGEDSPEAYFSLSLFQAAVQGYAREAKEFILEEEWRAILPATYSIYIELAARFCADILNESYFNWDPRRFASRGEHNEIRALSQLRAARSLRDKYEQAEKIVERAFGDR